MSEVDEETLEIIRRHIRQLALKSDGKPSLRDVLLSLGKELDPNIVRKLISTIKKEIITISSQSLEELRKEDDSDGEKMIENEYDELASSFKVKMAKKSYVSSLITYGSYGKGNHIMGQSNLNFLLILKNLEDLKDAEQEKIRKDINTEVESLMNPLFESLFDLCVLFDQDVESLEAFKKRMDPRFSAIQAYSASKSTPLLGKNPFTSFSLEPEIQKSAEIMLNLSVSNYKIGSKEHSKAMNKKGSNEKNVEIEYFADFSAETIIDYALALTYFVVKDVAHITKPDIREKFREVFGNNAKFKPYIAAVEQAFAYRLGITKIGEDNITETELINYATEFTIEVDNLLKHKNK